MDMKRMIAQTYADMVKHGNVDKITVKALIEACHISRQTFYYHFQDIMDVLEWSVRESTQTLVEQSLQTDSLREVLRIFIAFSAERYPMLRKLLESQRRAQIEQIMFDAAKAYLEELARHKQKDLPLNYAAHEVLLWYNASGLVGILLQYCGKPDLDREWLAAQLEQLLSGELSGLGK